MSSLRSIIRMTAWCVLVAAWCVVLVLAIVYRAYGQDYDLYTGSPDGIFRVDLASGYTQQVVSFPDANVAGYLYDGTAIHAVTANPWKSYIQPFGCGGYYANWIRGDRGNGLPLPTGLSIDPATWQVSQEQAVAAITGTYATSFDDCDPPFMYLECVAGGFSFHAPGPRAYDNFQTHITLSFGGATYDFGVWPQGDPDNTYPLNPGGAQSPGFVIYAAVSPVDGTVWCVSFRGGGGAAAVIQLAQFDPVSLTVLVVFDTQPFVHSTGKGPIAFDPAGNLWRYDYDDQGNGWLNQIDLTTGAVVQRSASFWAPAESLWFMPRQ